MNSEQDVEVRSRYIFQCNTCDEWSERDSMNDVLCPCGGETVLRKACYNSVKADRSKEIPFPQVSVFKPYTENNFGHKPVEVETRQQRDQILAERGLTYDGDHYTKRKPYVPAADQVTLDEVMQHVHDPENQAPIRVGTPDGGYPLPVDGEPPVVRSGSGEIDP